jgi:hypothetical protein
MDSYIVVLLGIFGFGLLLGLPVVIHDWRAERRRRGK